MSECVAYDGAKKSEISGIKCVMIANDVKVLSCECFEHSTLQRVTFACPSSLCQIEKGAFAFSNLSVIEIPSSVEELGESCFRGCKFLKHITFELGSLLKQIGFHAFEESGLLSIDIPRSVENLPESCFEKCDFLKRVTFEESDNSMCLIASIGGSAFSGCSGLTSVTIPDSVTSIGDCAFCDCSSLTSVTIPDSVTSMGDSAFVGCSKLKIHRSKLKRFPDA